MSHHNVWKNVALPSWRLLAQAAVTDEEIEKARQLTWQQTRDIAQKQIERAKALLSDVSGITWTDGAIPAYLHWKPYREVIDNAESNFKLAETESDFVRKKEYYILAWRTARIAVDRIADEAKKDRSYWTVLAEPYVDKVIDKAKQAIDEAKRKAEDTASLLFKAALVLGGLYVIASARK